MTAKIQLRAALDTIGNRFGRCSLQEPVNMTFDAPNVYKAIPGDFSDGTMSGFEIAEGDHKLTYLGPSANFLFVGTSDISANKACTITYVLVINGIPLISTETPNTITVQDRTRNISATQVIQLNEGDEIGVYVKSTDATVVLTVRTLNIVFWGT